MKIGEAAKETGLTISNIRFYERKGLLAPVRQNESKYRDFSEEDIIRLKKIIVLRRAGISIEYISLLLEGKITLQETLDKQENLLQEQMEQLNGSMKLCRMMREEASLEHLNAEWYMQYMEAEKERGGSFAEVDEFVEDLADYTAELLLQSNPMLGRLWRRKGVRAALAVCWWVVLPVIFVLDYGIGGTRYPVTVCIILVIWFLPLVSFFTAHRRKKSGR